MGRPRKYATEEEAAEAKKQQDKISGKNFTKKLKNDPTLHERNKAQKRNWYDKYLENMTPQEKKAYNEYQKTKKQESRAKKENKPKATPSKKALSSITKPIQLKVSCEQSAEIGIEKKASPTEVKKTVHSPV